MLERAILSGLRPTRAEISLSALRHNFRAFSALVGPDVAVMAVVKANAYGHGVVEVAGVLASEGAAWLGVALPEEGVELRDAGIALPILCLGGFWEGQERLLLDFDLTPAISRIDQLIRLDAEAARRGITVAYHLKIDTGLGRLGVATDELVRFLAIAESLTHVRCDGLMTHLASADVPSLAEFTRGQIRRFEDSLDRIERRGHRPRWRQIANGAGAHAFPEARGNLVRPGAVLYGLAEDTLSPDGPELVLQPVMRFVTRIEHLKTVPAGTPLGYGCTYTTTAGAVVATVPAGYADGVRRALSNVGWVGVRGVRAPIVGRVSMDLTIVDVTAVRDVALGDEVVLFGDGGPTAEEVAGLAGTISYEITCGVSSRVPRLVV